MALRTQTLAVTGTILVLMMLIIFSISGSILLGGYARLEKQSILHDVEQVERVLDGELAHLSAVVGDWAPWDDTYQFVQDLNRGYIDNNLMDSTIINLHADFLIFKNTDNEMVYCKFVDPKTGKGAVCPDSLRKYLSSGPLLLQNEHNKDTFSGLALLPENPIFIASAPILNSQFQGPSRGQLIVGRYITATEIHRLSSKINVSFTLERMDRSDFLLGFDEAKSGPLKGEKVAVVEGDDDTLLAYVVVNGFCGDPILMVGIKKERKILAQGKRSMHYFIVSLLVVGLVFIFVTLLFLEMTVLSRVVRLNMEIKNIGDTGDLSKRTRVSGHDELATLSSEINQMLESVRISTERDKTILETMEDGYFELDLKGRVTFSNHSLAGLLRCRKAGLLGADYRHLLDEGAAERAFRVFNQLYKTGRPVKNLETGFALGDGGELFLESSASVIRDATGQIVGFRGIVRDVTLRKRTSEKLFHLAYHDSLTELFNRKAFHEHLGEELIHATRYRQRRSLLFMDLDKFKTVNDTYGHDTGDQLLKAFAIRIQKCLRTKDRVYRLGGDEFAVILSDLEVCHPDVVVQRIVDEMKKVFHLEKAVIDFVTVSIGISVFPVDGTDVETLLACADKAMYRIKRHRDACLQV